MFRAIISPILRSTKLCLYLKLQTQFSAPEDGINYRPKRVELIEIMNTIIIVASSWLFVLLYINNFTTGWVPSKYDRIYFEIWLKPYGMKFLLRRICQ